MDSQAQAGKSILHKGIPRYRQAAHVRRGDEEALGHVAGSGAKVPLRTHTITSGRLRIKTYQDTQSMREAFERLKQICGAFSLDEDEEISCMIPRVCDSGNPAPAQLNRMPGHLIVHCFSFCDLSSLGQLSRVSRRLAAFANAHHIWVEHAKRLNKPVRGPETARADLRFEVCGRWDAEIQEHEQAYEDLQRRLQERAAAERAAVLDVEGVLNENRRNVRGGDILRSRGSNNSNIYSVADVQALQAKVEQLEAVKLELLRSVRDLGDILAQQQAQIQDMQNRLAVRVTAEGDVVTTTSSCNTVDGTATHVSPPELTLHELTNFERRMCRLVLGTIPDLSVVLRRGVDDFGTMEMLVQHSGGELESGIRKRWQAFKSFFPPLSNDYSKARFYLLSGESAQSERRNESITRCSAIVRRLMKMSDSEITDIVMQSGSS
ncbi:F-box domain containing protein, putative [Trypanosoma equiperdum]|uniref:F-box domain containing protein, putative n=1 Tax=Trypanosoma equiperdum TaxID=5694 RepID=A0A1G4I5A1_TRYEQ|nr:F-box domain containing protein, putative [Trypanosoma equiperdum]